MTYKKILIVFLIFFTIFGFSTVFGAENTNVTSSNENTNVTSSNTERMKWDIDCFKQVLKDYNINNMNDLKSFVGANKLEDLQYFYIEDAGHRYYATQYVFFYSKFDNISAGVDNYNYYGIQQNSFTLPYSYCSRYFFDGTKNLLFVQLSTRTFTAPVCWFGVKTIDLFTKDSSQIIENVLTQDKSSQDDINLNSHNDEMNNASDSIKNSNLYNKFSKLSNELQEAFTYDDNDVTTLPISFNNKNVVLKSNEISKFFLYNNLGFVITLWQSILWFSLFYTMFIFIRKIYKAVVGGNSVDDVSNTLSNEDDKMVGGF